MTELLLGGGVVVEVVDPFPLTVTEATPPVASDVEVIAVPGPPGAAGAVGDALTPTEMAQITDATTGEVLIDLEPPVDLVLLFENALI